MAWRRSGRPSDLGVENGVAAVITTTGIDLRPASFRRLFEHLDPAQPREHHVEDDQVRRLVAREAECPSVPSAASTKR